MPLTPITTTTRVVTIQILPAIIGSSQPGTTSIADQ